MAEKTLRAAHQPEKRAGTHIDRTAVDGQMARGGQAFSAGGKMATLYPAAATGRPLVVLNVHSGDGEDVARELAADETGNGADSPNDTATAAARRHTGAATVNLLVVGNLDWNRDMSPWRCESLFKRGDAFIGGADDYLALLTSEILPRARSLIKGTPRRTCIAGYSLAGLFALYALYRCDAFDRAASMSGSLWFPGFEEFARTHEMPRHPDKIHLSLGRAEAKTAHPLLKTVRTRTETVADHFRALGIDVTYELNPGGHFRDVPHRCANGIRAIS